MGQIGKNIVLNDGRFIGGILAHLREIETVPLEMAEFGDHLIGVKDIHTRLGRSEFDVYFDKRLWVPRNPIIWGDSLYPRDLKKFNMGVLEGLGQFQQPHNMKELMAFAKKMLQSEVAATYPQFRMLHLSVAVFKGIGCAALIFGALSIYRQISERPSGSNPPLNLT